MGISRERRVEDGTYRLGSPPFGRPGFVGRGVDEFVRKVGVDKVVCDDPMDRGVNTRPINIPRRQSWSAERRIHRGTNNIDQ